MENERNEPKTKSIGKGWNRMLKTWIALSRDSAERRVYRDAIKQMRMGEYLIQQETVAMAKGVDAQGAWWGGKQK